MRSVVKDIARAAARIPATYRDIARDPSEFIASAISLNLLWGVYMFFVEGFIAGFTLAAIVSLRLSAVIWNTIFGPYAHIMEVQLAKKWHRPVHVPTRRYLLPFRALRWYAVATGISLISQVPIQAVAYPMAIYFFGHATWGGLLPLTLVEWTTPSLFFKNSWFPIAILFSPLLGPIFNPITTAVQHRIKKHLRRAHARLRPPSPHLASQKVTTRRK